MNFVQAVGVVAKGKGDGIVVATMGAMFIFDRIEGADGNATGVPLVSGKVGLVLGLGVAYIKEHSGGNALIAMLAHLAGVEVAQVKAALSEVPA